MGDPGCRLTGQAGIPPIAACWLASFPLLHHSAVNLGNLESVRPVPTPLPRRWQLFRNTGLPRLVFALAFVSTIWLWHINRPQPVQEAASWSDYQGVSKQNTDQRLAAELVGEPLPVRASPPDSSEWPGAATNLAAATRFQ